MYKTIEEVIDALLPQGVIETAYVDIPSVKSICVIEETNVNGKTEDLDGYSGLHTSNIQFWVRKQATQGSYIAVRNMLESFYRAVLNAQGNTYGNYEIELISDYSVSNAMKDKDNNTIMSMIFGIRYRVIV